MNLWFKIFGKDPKQLFLNWHPEKSSWRTVTWNFDVTDPKERLWIVELFGAQFSSIQWKKLDQQEIKFYQGKSLVNKIKISEEAQDLKALMNLAIHSTIKLGLEENLDFMLAPVSGATIEDMQNEARALQWVQASFGVLTRALERMATDRSLILTAAFFSGFEKQSGKRIVRLIAMNLDISFYLSPDSSLQILIFDDKGEAHGSSKSPVFQQNIKVTKPQFYDEIIKLVHTLAAVGEIR
jgi:hypothetical protein